MGKSGDMLRYFVRAIERFANYLKLTVLIFFNFLLDFVVKKIANTLSQLFLILVMLKILSQLIEIPVSYVISKNFHGSSITSHDLNPGDLTVINIDGSISEKLCGFESPEFSYEESNPMRTYSELMEDDIFISDVFHWLKHVLGADFDTEQRYTLSYAVLQKKRYSLSLGCTEFVSPHIKDGKCVKIVDSTIEIFPLEGGLEPTARAVKLRMGCIVTSNGDPIWASELRVPWVTTLASFLGLISTEDLTIR